MEAFATGAPPLRSAELGDRPHRSDRVRQYGLILAALLLALAIGYWAGHSETSAASAAHPATLDSDNSTTHASTSEATKAAPDARPTRATAPPENAPLPPPGTPFKDTRTELQARAEAGDAEAAYRFYRDTLRCAEHLRNKTSAPRLAEIALSDSDKKGSRSGGDTAFLDMAQKQLDFVRANAAFCADLDSTDVDPLFLPSALRAALLGDIAAADCYVSGGGTFGIPPGLLDHPEWLADYRENALAIANAAIEKGDWTMVAQLAGAYEGVRPGLLQQVVGRNNAFAYRYLKLSRLGARNDDENVPYLDARLSAAATDMPPDIKAAADAWAQDAYQRYFSAGPPNTAYNSYRVCQTDGL